MFITSAEKEHFVSCEYGLFGETMFLMDCSEPSVIRDVSLFGLQGVEKFIFNSRKQIYHHVVEVFPSMLRTLQYNFGGE